MAWRFYTGVQENFPVTITPPSNPSDDRNTSIADIPCGAIRLIYPPDGQNQAKSHIQTLVNNGKYVIPTIFDHKFNTATDAKITTVCQQYAAALDGLVDVIEFVNEPLEASKGGPRNDPPANNRYLQRLDAAIPIFNAHGIKTLVGGNASSQDPMGMLADIDAYGGLWSRLGGVGFHPYFSTVGTNLSTGMFGYINSFRNKLDSYGAAATALPIYITEFGWGNEPPGGSPPNLLCDPKTGTMIPSQKAREVDQASRLSDSFDMFVAHAEALKVRAACWFWLSDWPIDSAVYANCGLRTHLSNRSRVTGTRFKPSMAALGTFDPVYDLAEAAPTAITIAPPTGIGQHGATLKGRVNPQGLPTTWHFNFRQQGSAVWQSVGSGSAGSGNVNVDVQYAIGLLGAGLTWEYQMVATSSGGSDTGTVQTFSTTPAPAGPDVVTGPAAAITAHSATLTGDIDPKGLPATWHFEWGTDPTLAVHSSTPERTLGAIILPGAHTLNVSPQGTGAGVVTSSPAGIDTSVPGGDQHDFPDGTVVTLTESPTAPDTFGGWSGDGTGAGTTRTVTMSAPRNVVATFTAPVIVPGPWTLTVDFAGGGSGTVTSSPAGINATSRAQHDFPDGTVVTLSQSHSGAYTFLGWTGNGVDSGVTDRQVTMTGNRSVTANFGVVAPSADWYVDASNPNPGSGTSGNPFKTINQAISAAAGGDVISVLAGNYSETISSSKSGYTINAEPGAALVGTGINTDHGFALTGSATNVTINDLEIFDISHGSNQTAALMLLGNPHDNNFNRVKIHKVKGPAVNAGAMGIGLLYYTSYPYSKTAGVYGNTFTDCEVYEIGAGSVDGYNESMGVFMSGAFNNTFDGCSIYLCRKEAIRDLDGLRNIVKNCHFFLNWSGGAPNYGSGSHWYNNASYFNQIGFEPKHTNFYLAGGAGGAQHWGAAEAASAANNRTIFAHNTTFGNIASSFDLGQGGDLFNFVTVKDNLFADRGTVNLRDFTPIGGSIIVDRNNYNTAPGTPPNAPRALYARDFPGTGSQDSSFSFSGYGGNTYEANGTQTPVTFTDPPSGNFNHSAGLTGEDLGDGYGTQVGCNGIGTAAKTWTQHTYTASTTMGNAGQLGSLSNGAYDDAWTATSNTGSLTFDLGSSKAVEVIVVDTIIRQNGPGQYQNYTIETSPDASTWTQRRAGSVVDDLRTSTKHRWPSVNARYVRLNINSMFQGGGDRAEICQVRLGHL